VVPKQDVGPEKKEKKKEARKLTSHEIHDPKRKKGTG